MAKVIRHSKALLACFSYHTFLSLWLHRSRNLIIYFTVLWEGPDALEGYSDGSLKPKKTIKKATSKKEPVVKTEFNADESEESISSEDEYVVESPGLRWKGSAAKVGN